MMIYCNGNPSWSVNLNCDSRIRKISRQSQFLGVFFSDSSGSKKLIKQHDDEEYSKSSTGTPLRTFMLRILEATASHQKKWTFNDEISEFFSRGFNIFQISQNVRLGVLIFSMLWLFFDHFALKNSLKKAQNFRALRARFFSPGF